MVRKRPHMDRIGLPEDTAVGANSHPLAERWKIAPSEESDPARVNWALKERIKELNCLYAIARLAEDRGRSLDEVIQSVVNIIPPSWQYPEITCARVVLRKNSFKTWNFKITRWCQSSPIVMYGETVGEVRVCYLEERPPSAEGPFLQEERALLDAIAERIGAISIRQSVEMELQETNRQLMVERKTLQETNTALRTVMARIEEEKREIHRHIRANVEKVLMPLVNELYVSAPREERKFVDLLRENLEEITSPFISRISERFRSLTPTEIKICSMVRGGLRTKEIAGMRGVSPSTISRHRERIRRKLGIVNNEINLATYLAMNQYE